MNTEKKSIILEDITHTYGMSKALEWHARYHNLTVSKPKTEPRGHCLEYCIAHRDEPTAFFDYTRADLRRYERYMQMRSYYWELQNNPLGLK